MSVLVASVSFNLAVSDNMSLAMKKQCLAPFIVTATEYIEIADGRVSIDLQI